jgi:hypothetical protein
LSSAKAAGVAKGEGDEAEGQCGFDFHFLYFWFQVALARVSAGLLIQTPQHGEILEVSCREFTPVFAKPAILS